MDKDNDFTFCQVYSPAHEDSSEVNRILPEISGMSLKGELSNTTGKDKDGIFLWKQKLPNNVASMRKGTIGSLSFNVIETSHQTPSFEELPKHISSDDALSSVNVSAVQKIGARKPSPRAKVPFEKGYSPMDWLKLTQKHPDLAGLKGQSNKRLISMTEVEQHTAKGGTWTVLKGRVYNLSPYLKFHPGGVNMIVKALGKDCTSIFNKYHAWVNAEFLLEKCQVGILDDRAIE